MVNLATDSEGETVSGHLVEQNRKRHAALRQRLEKRGTKSAKRHLNLSVAAVKQPIVAGRA